MDFLIFFLDLLSMMRAFHPYRCNNMHLGGPQELDHIGKSMDSLLKKSLIL